MKSYKKCLIFFAINVAFPIFFYLIFKMYLIPNAVLFFLINMIITSLLIILYILFISLIEEEENFDIFMIIKCLKDKIDEKKILLMQFNVDIFIVTSSFIIPNLVFCVFAINNGIFLYSLSLLPFIIILIIALIRLSNKGKKAQDTKNFLLKQILDEFETNKSKLESIEFYNLVKTTKIITYPKISIIILIIGAISQIFTFNFF